MWGRLSACGRFLTGLPGAVQLFPMRFFPNGTEESPIKGRDWITTEEWSDNELDVLLDVSADLKRKFRGRVPHRYLPDQTIFLMFFDKSTRTATPSKPA